MESIQWNSSFNSSFHVNPSSTPFNFPRTLVKTSSFNELGNSSFDSVLAPKLDAAMFSGLSSAVLAAAAAGNFVPSSTISPFFHSIQMPALSRSISSEYTATPAVASVEAASELESPDSDSRSLCLSPDEQETQDADREQNPREMAELDLHPTVNSPRSEADSDEWSVPATNNETDSANQSHTRTQTPTIPIIKNSSLMDITAATHHAGSAAKTEEFSDSEINDDQEESDHDNDNDNEQDLGTSLENQREHDDDNDNDDELAEVEEDEAEAEVQAESDVEEEVLARPTRSSRRCKASKQKSKINSSRQVASKQGRRGSSARKAPISSAARLASQKKYDEKRRGIYRRLYTDLKDAIRAAQEVEGVKRDALEEQRLAELKRGKKKKKKKQKEIEDLSTRELLMLATNTIQLLQNHKNQLDQEWSQVKLQTAKEENDGEENVKPERADRKRKRGGVKNEKQMKINNRSQTMGADSIKSESDCSPPKRSRTDSSTTSTSSSSSSSSNVVNALLAALNNSQSSHQVALPLPINPSTMSWSNTPIKPEFVSPSNSSSSSSSTSSASPLLLLGANSASSSAPVVTVIDEAKRRAIFLFLFLRLRSLVLSSPPLLSVLQTSNSNSGQLWKSTLMSLLNCEWSEESVRVVPQEKLLVKMSQMIWALQCMQQDIEVITAGQKNPQMKEHWANVATVKRELESYAGNNVTNDS